MSGIEIHTLLADLETTPADSEWQLLATLYGQAIQPIHDFIRAFRAAPDADHWQVLAVVHLVCRSISDLVACGHLASHRFLPQAYCVLRPVLDARDLIELFVEDPSAAESWLQPGNTQRDFSPSRVRQRLGRNKYDRGHGLLSELGSHPRFTGMRMNLALEHDETTDVRSDPFAIGPSPIWHPSTLYAWRTAFNTTFELAEATLPIVELAVDQDAAFGRCVAAEIRCVDAVRSGTVLILRKLGEDFAQVDEQFGEASKRLSALLASDT
jgi:hypothetical protein